MKTGSLWQMSSSTAASHQKFPALWHQWGSCGCHFKSRHLGMMEPWTTKLFSRERAGGEGEGSWTSLGSCYAHVIVSLRHMQTAPCQAIPAQANKPRAGANRFSGTCLLYTMAQPLRCLSPGRRLAVWADVTVSSRKVCACCNENVNTRLLFSKYLEKKKSKNHLQSAPPYCIQMLHAIAQAGLELPVLQSAEVTGRWKLSVLYDSKRGTGAIQTRMSKKIRNDERLLLRARE